MAYAYANLSGVGALGDPSRCLVWSEELTDIKKLLSGENLYLRLTDSQGIGYFMPFYVLLPSK
jgi:hypothetical protein